MGTFGTLSCRTVPFAEHRNSGSSRTKKIYYWSRYQEGKTNLSHDGLNPAHVPYLRVNNPTLGVFCYTMIGRADIEESKSHVAMNAWRPQASYPCGNFSGTCRIKERFLHESGRIDRPCFHSQGQYWRPWSSKLLSFYSTRGFRPL